MSIITVGAGAGLGIAITVPLPPFPNVPNLPGVPQIARSLLFQALAPPALGFAAEPGILWQATQAAPVWGVFDANNNEVINADSVQDFGWRQEYRVSNYQIQRGAFASFNKVALPFESSVVLSKGGSLSARTTFLQQIDTVAASLALYKILTPEKTYLNVNVTRPELSRRGAENACFFDVELFFVQIAEVEQQYSTSTPGAPSTANSSVPSAVPPINSGQNNPQTPSTAVQSAALAAIVPPSPTG
jgi:hypothetical protein